jgi:hypothetical protein
MSEALPTCEALTGAEALCMSVPPEVSVPTPSD